MTIEEIIKYIAQWAKRFETRLSELLQSLDTRVHGMQRSLTRRFLEAVLEMFDFEGGKLKKTTKNIAALRKLERLFENFEREIIRDELALFAAELLEIGGLTVEYYEATSPAAKAAAIKNSLELLRSVMGITADGGLVEGGYLDRLGKTVQIRETLRQYVVQSIVSKRSLTDFQRGLRDLVEGKPGIDGALQAYWRQYAYDTYNQAHEVVNVIMADELELQHFIYQGSIIPTSREFCRKKAGKVFTRQEALKWKNDPDLIDKKTAASYNPFIERGRYNCRHWLNWISQDLAEQLRPDLKKK